jgi:shikimate kinase
MICLIGFMGAGKTTVGSMLAEKIRQPAYDLDQLILEQSGYATVADIFLRLGENGFRDLESHVLASLLSSKQSGVLMTGGGVVERDSNRELLHTFSKLGGKVVYLKTDFTTLSERLKDDASRPLFKDPAVALERYQKRSFFYEEVATATVTTDGISPQELVDTLVQLFAGSPHE